MQKSILTLIMSALLMHAFGQKTEWSLSANSGLFSFTGKSASRTTFVNYSQSTNSGYTNNPYGSMNALCYGLSVNLKRVTNHKFLIGFDLGYENLRSKVAITEIADYTGTSNNMVDATGRTFLNNHFINLYPYWGYRFTTRKLHFDITGGFDIAFDTKMFEKGSVSIAGGTKFSPSGFANTAIDFRPRIQLSAGYRKFGVYIGYSYGIWNYQQTSLGGGPGQCYSRLARFGFTYRLN